MTNKNSQEPLMILDKINPHGTYKAIEKYPFDILNLSLFQKRFEIRGYTEKDNKIFFMPSEKILTTNTEKKSRDWLLITEEAIIEALETEEKFLALTRVLNYAHVSLKNHESSVGHMQKILANKKKEMADFNHIKAIEKYPKLGEMSKLDLVNEYANEVQTGRSDRMYLYSIHLVMKERARKI